MDSIYDFQITSELNVSSDRHSKQGAALNVDSGHPLIADKKGSTVWFLGWFWMH